MELSACCKVSQKNFCTKSHHIKVYSFPLVSSDPIRWCLEDHTSSRWSDIRVSQYYQWLFVTRKLHKPQPKNIPVLKWESRRLKTKIMSLKHHIKYNNFVQMFNEIYPFYALTRTENESIKCNPEYNLDNLVSSALSWGQYGTQI